MGSIDVTTAALVELLCSEILELLRDRRRHEVLVGTAELSRFVAKASCAASWRRRPSLVRNRQTTLPQAPSSCVSGLGTSLDMISIFVLAAVFQSPLCWSGCCVPIVDAPVELGGSRRTWPSVMASIVSSVAVLKRRCAGRTAALSIVDALVELAEHGVHRLVGRCVACAAALVELLCANRRCTGQAWRPR